MTHERKYLKNKFCFTTKGEFIFLLTPYMMGQRTVISLLCGLWSANNSSEFG